MYPQSREPGRHDPHESRPVPSLPLGGIRPGGQPVVGGSSGTAEWVPPGSPAGGQAWGPTGAQMPVVLVATGHRVGGTMAIVGGCLGVAGTFLRWVTADLEGLGIRNGNGWRNVLGAVSWGPGIAFMALVVTMIGAICVGGVSSRAAKAVGIIAALIMLAMSAAQAWDVVRDHPGATTSMGPGTTVDGGGCDARVDRHAADEIPGICCYGVNHRAVGAVG